MHIADGVLAPGLIAGGWAVAGVTTALCVRSLREEEIPRTAVLTACFFVGSLVHVPLGGPSVHLALNGLCGVVLGPPAFVAVFIGLLLQSVLFHHGGISALGFNACAMGFPALAAWAGFRLWGAAPWGRRHGVLLAGAFCAGGGAVLAAAVLAGAGLAVSGEQLARIAPWLVGGHLVVALVEGVFTMATVKFLMRVQPSLIAGEGA